MKIKGSGSEVPKKVTIDDGSLLCTMQLWTEVPARVVIRADEIQNCGQEVFTQWSPVDRPKVSLGGSALSRGAAGKAIQPRTTAETCGEDFGTCNTKLGFIRNQSPNATLGKSSEIRPDKSGKNKKLADVGHMPFNEVLSGIKMLATLLLEALSLWESSSKLQQGVISIEKGSPSKKTRGKI